MPHLPSGARARRFVLELALEAPDGFGGVVRSFAPGPQVWGAMELVRAEERRRGERSEQAATYRVTIPWRADVTGAMRLALGPRRFAIRSAADPDGTRRQLVCTVEEISP